MVAVAIVGAAAVGAGGSYAASKSASSAAKKAAKKNNNTQTQIYNENKAALAPYVGAGQPATTAIQGLLGLGGDPNASAAAFNNYKLSTEYDSRLKQGENSVTSALGSKGLLDSGAAQKSLASFGQTFASNEFDKYLTNLEQQQGVGLTAASAQAGVGQSYANAVSANNNNAAAATGNAALAGANALNGVLNSAVGSYGLLRGMGSSYGTAPTSSFAGIY